MHVQSTLPASLLLYYANLHANTIHPHTSIVQATMLVSILVGKLFQMVYLVQ